MRHTENKIEIGRQFSNGINIKLGQSNNNIWHCHIPYKPADVDFYLTEIAGDSSRTQKIECLMT